MRRRTILLNSAAAFMTVPGRPQAANIRSPGPPDSRRLTLRHAASGAVFSGPYHNGLAADPAAMAELSEVLADTRTGAVRLFDSDAIDIVWEMGRRQRVAEFVVLSGYRTQATNRQVGGAGDSQHLVAAALDLQIPAGKFSEFGEAALRLGRGGVGLYPNHGFIHLDSGPVRRWDDGGRPATKFATVAPPVRSAVEQRIDRLAEAWGAIRKR